MIGLRILGSLDKSPLTLLKLKENMYLWKTSSGRTFYDGPTMLQILIETVKPSLRTGIADLKDKLRGSKLSTFKYNVKKMTDKMQGTYNEILKHGQTHEDFILDLFCALLTCKNDVFHGFITQEQDKYETGEDIIPGTLIKDSVTKYNNMITKNQWNAGESKDAKIVALTTQLKQLEKKFDGKKFPPKVGNTSKGSETGSRFTLDKWRLTKSAGSSTECDGKTWY